MEVKGVMLVINEEDFSPYIIEVYEEGNESYFKYESDKAYWTNKFDKTRRDRAGRKNPKGFLEVIY